MGASIRISSRLPSIILFLSFIGYVSYWSYITILRYYALNAYVFDLGIFMQNGWVVLHQVHTVSAFLAYLAYDGIVYVFSPLTLLDSYPALLILQSVVIALAMFPLYGIAKHFLKGDVPALLFAISYLIYFPLAGMNWYDAHNAAFFPTLFISAYYFYLKGRTIPSAALFTLSAMIRFPYMIFPLGFALMVLGGEVIGAARHRGVNPSKLKLSIYLIAFCASMAILWYLFVMDRSVILGGSFTTSVLSSVRGTLFQSPSVDLGDKLLTIILFLAPLLFMTILSRKWLPFLLPYLFLLFFTGNAVYRFPSVFELQYTAGVVPFVYLGAIEGTGHLSRLRRLRLNRRKLTVLASALLIAVMAFAMVNEPYGPLNGYSGVNFSLKANTAVNTGLYAELDRMMGMIPASDPYILMQNNMPELLPRPLAYVPSSVPFNQFPLLPSSVSTALNYGRLPNGTQIPARIDYVITDPYSDQYYAIYAPAPYNASMYDLVRELYSSGNYGIVAEASGMVLLERGYNGSLEYYVPTYLNFTPGQLYVSDPAFAGPVIRATNFNGLVWYGPYTNLSPGSYNVTFWLSTTNSSPSNALQLQITANQGGTYISGETITGAEMQPGSWTAFTIPITVIGFYGLVEFRGISLAWNGSILLKGITLLQTSPG